MESLFNQMLAGKTPCVLIAQDADHAAILEPNPAAPGHVVVFPKKPEDALFNLTPEALAQLMRFTQIIAHALKSTVPCDKVALVVYGLKVRHAHLHLIPANGNPAEITLDKPRSPADRKSLEHLANQIRAKILESQK